MNLKPSFAIYFLVFVAKKAASKERQHLQCQSDVKRLSFPALPFNQRVLFDSSI